MQKVLGSLIGFTIFSLVSLSLLLLYLKKSGLTAEAGHSGQAGITAKLGQLLQPGESQPEPAPVYNPSPLDHTSSKPASTDHFVLHKTFPLAQSVKFEFQVPPHVAMPRLNGSFRSYVRGADPAHPGPANADIDYLLLNSQQYAEFQHGGAGTAVDSADQTRSHEVSVTLSPTFSDPQTYYIIFRNTSASPQPKLVQADFTASFAD
jgi:hypothetical protein